MKQGLKMVVAALEGIGQMAGAIAGGLACAAIFGGLAALVNPVLGAVVGLAAFIQGSKETAKEWSSRDDL